MDFTIAYNFFRFKKKQKNMKNKLLSPNNLCFQILSLNANVKLSPDSALSQKFDEFFSKISITKYSKFQLRKIKNDLDAANTNFQDILIKYSYNFPFCQDLISQIIDKIKYKNDSIEFVSFFLLNEYLSWSLNFYQNFDISLLKSLISLLDGLNLVSLSTKDELIHDLSISSFFHAFRYALNSRKVEDLTSFISPLNDFFVFNRNLPESTYELLSNMAYDVIEQNHQPQKGLESELYSVINNLFKLPYSSIPPNITLNIIERSYFAIGRLDFSVLSFLQNCSNIIDDQVLIKFLPIIPKAFFEMIEKSEIITKKPNFGNEQKKCYIKIDKTDSIKITFHPVEQSTFDKTPTLQNVIFPNIAAWNKLISDKHIMIIRYINDIIKNKTTLVERFFSDWIPFLTIALQSEHCFDIFAAFFLIFEIFTSNNFHIKIKRSLLFNKIIFDPMLTVFDENFSEYQNVSTIRSIAFNFLIDHKDSKNIRKIFLEAVETPLLYAELVHRLIKKYIDFSNKSNVHNISYALIDPMIIYQRCNKDDRQLVNIARTAILTFFSNIFRSQQNLTIFFSNSHFVQFILALLYEKPLRMQIIRYLYQFLTTSENIKNPITNKIITNISIIISNEICNLNSVESIELMTSILEIVNIVMSEIPSFQKEFEQTSTLLCNQLTQVPHNKEYQSLLNASLQFINFANANRKLKFNEIHSLEIAISNICGDEPDNEFADILFQLYSHGNEITNSSLVYLYLQAFSHSSKIYKCFERLTELCSINFENCVTLHNGEIDLLVLKYIDNWRTNDKISKQIIRDALNFIFLISSHISTFAVVQKYISLLSPLDGRYFPYFNVEIISTLNSLMLNHIRVPQNYLPLYDNAEISATVTLPDSFSICFWICSKTNNGRIKSTIFSLTDGKTICKLEMRGSFLELHIHQENIISNKINNKIPLDKWILLTFNFNISDMLCIDIFLNEKQVSSFKIETTALFNKKQPVNITINCKSNLNSPRSFADYSNNQRLLSLLGPFAIMNLIDQNYISSLAREGPKKHSFIIKSNTSQDLIIAGFLPKIEKGREFYVTNLTNVQFQSNIKKISYPYDFIDVLIKFCKIETLIPLFAQVDMIYKNNSTIDCFMDVIVSLFQELLVNSIEAQESFTQSSGFYIISHLLRHSSEKHFTYKLFLMFFNLFKLLQNDQLKKDLFISILTDLEIWLKTSESDHIKILHQLFKETKQYEKIFLDCFDTKHFIILARILYWYEPIEKKIIHLQDNRVRGQKLNVQKCRKYLFKIAMKIAQKKIDQTDIDTIICAATTCLDFNQISDYLGLLDNLIRYKIIGYNESLLKLLTIITIYKPNLSYKVIKIFTHFDILPNIVDELMINYYIYLYNKKLLIKLAKLKQPNLIRLCSWISTATPINISINQETKIKESSNENSKQVTSNLSNKSVQRMTSILLTYNEKEIDSQELWTIFLLFSRKSRKIQRNIVKYLVKSRINNLSKLFSQIKYVMNVLNIKENHILRITLMEMMNTVNDKNLNSIKTNFIHFIFFDNDLMINPILFRLISTSPFRNELITFENIQNEYFEINNPKQLCNIAKQHAFNEDQLKFGIHLSEEGEWLDAEIALKALTNLPKFDLSLEFSSLLLGFYIITNRYSNFNSEKLTLINSIKDKYKDSFDIQILKYFENNSRDFDCIKSTFDFLEKLHDSFVDDPIEFIPLSNEIQRSFLGNNIDIFQFNEYYEKIQKSSELWSHFWRSMTISRAPWSSSLSPEFQQKNHYKRDKAYCFSYCPFKTRINFSFDDHLYASFSRDSGNFQKAQQELAKHIERKVSYNDPDTLPLQILNIDEFENMAPHKELSTDSLPHVNTKFQFECKDCEHVTPKNDYKSIFIVSSDYISITHKDSNSIKIIETSSILNIFLRTRLHRLTAIEIFTDVKHSYFIDFFESKVLNKALGALKKIIPSKSIQSSSFEKYFAEQTFTQDWISRKISNFQYLMLLNIYSGRSFNSISQYPYVPWVLIDFSSDNIDLEDSSIYRDLSKPVGALNSSRLKDLQRKRDNLARLGNDPYLFSSGSVCPLSVYLWLIRLEPFTSLHIQFQGGKFDHAARIFYSVPDSFRLATSHMNDFRELIPEFYYMPEFLLNNDKFNLGKLSNSVIDNVDLPKWANNSPYEFVYTMRKALESEYVSQHLNEWIDLVWGSKQRDKNNRFKSEMYSDVWTNFQNLNKDEEEKVSIEAVLSQVGQIPPQLFTDDHPKRCTVQQKESAIDEYMRIDLDVPGTILKANTYQMDNTSNLRIIMISDPGYAIMSTIQIASKLNTTSNHRTVRRFSVSNGLNNLLLMRKSHSADLNSEIPKLEKFAKQISFFKKEINGFSNMIPKEEDQILSFFGSDDDPFLVCVGNDKTDLISIKIEHGLPETIMSNHVDIVGLANDGVWTAIAGKDAIIHLFKNFNFKERPSHSIMSFCDSITCSVVSSTFDTMVCGTKDKSLLICSLSRGNVTNDIEFDKDSTIKKILITPSWGFILVYTESMKNKRIVHMITLYNINGNFIRNREINFTLSHWTSWTSEKNFDYIFLADENGKFYMFEAFYLNIDKPFFRSGRHLVHINYFPEVSIALAISSDGKLFLVPYVLK